jgi:hypothetical protein
MEKVTIKNNGNGKYKHLKVGKEYEVTAEIKGILEKQGVLSDLPEKVNEEEVKPKKDK